MLKKILSFLCLIIFISISLSGQFDKRFQFGFTGGWNYSFFAGKNVKNIYPLYGYNISIFTLYQFNDYFSIIPKVSFNKSGGTVSGNYDNEEVNISIASNYINGSILSNFSLFNSYKFKPSVIIGPYVSYKIYSETQIETEENIEKINDNIKDDDYGLTFGLGGLFFNQYLVEIKLDYGLANINNYNVFDFDELKTRSINLCLGFLF